MLENIHCKGITGSRKIVDFFFKKEAIAAEDLLLQKMNDDDDLAQGRCKKGVRSNGIQVALLPTK